MLQYLHMKSLNQYSLILFSSATAAALIASALCFAAELNKSKKNDLRFNGKLCHLPQSSAFGLGIAALVSLSAAQIIGSFFVRGKLRSSEKISKVERPSFSSILMVFSWVSFGVAIVLIGGASSMSRSQPFGEGWLDGECYLVRDGVYIGSGLLSLAALGSALGSGAIEMSRRKAEEDRKVHAQVDE